MLNLPLAGSVKSILGWPTCSIFAKILVWVNITPFGSPVVPLEYGKMAISSGLGGSKSGISKFRLITCEKSIAPCGSDWSGWKNS